MKQINTIKKARWSFYAGITFVLLLALLHIIKPELDPSWNFISEYEVGRFGWLMSAAFLSLAISSICLPLALWKSINIVGKIGLILLFVSASGMIIAAIFKTDPLNTSPALVTPSGKLHQLGAMLDMVPFAAILITIALFRNKNWQNNKVLLLILLLLVWFGFIYFMASVHYYFPADGKFGPKVPVGWQNRSMIVTQAVWLIALAKIIYRKKALIETNSIAPAP